MDTLLTSLDIVSQGMAVQRQRLNAIANNMANVNTTKDVDGEPYKRQIVLVRAKKNDAFSKAFEQQIQLASTDASHAPNASLPNQFNDKRVVRSLETKDPSPPRMIYDPSHPDANEEGYVAMPNVNVVTEMVDMIIAQRAFQANTTIFTSAKNMARNAIDMGQ